MERDEMIAEISMRTDIPMEDVEAVIDEEEMIFVEKMACRKKKKRRCICVTMLVFIAGAVAAMFILDKKEKIDIEDIVKKNVKKYMDKMHA